MGSNRSHLEATYVDANTLKVANDWTGDFATWTRVELVFSNGTKKYAHVIGQSYSSPDTTIDISEDILDSTLTHVAPGLVSSGDKHGVPIHSHDDPESNEGHGGPIPYTCRRAIFEYVDTDTVTIGPCRYYIQKETATLPFHKQVVWSNHDLTFDFSGLGASQIQYVYIDHSYVIANIKNGKLTAACFYNSTTAPTWSNSRHGWYNGDDLCINALKTNTSSEIFNFAQLDNYIYDYEQEDSFNLIYNVDIDSSWITFSSNIPAFSRVLLAGFILAGDTGWKKLFTRPTDSGFNGQKIMQQNINSTAISYNTCNMTYIKTSSSQQFDLKMMTDNNAVIYAVSYGWKLGEGM